MANIPQDYFQGSGKGLVHWMGQAIPGLCWHWLWQTSLQYDNTLTTWPSGQPVYQWLGAAGHEAYLHREIWLDYYTGLLQFWFTCSAIYSTNFVYVCVVGRGLVSKL